MARKLVIAIVLLVLTLLSTTSFAGGYQRYVIYYSDSTFNTPVGKKFYPSFEECDPPYDIYHETGSTTLYIYRQTRDICGTQGVSASCAIGNTYVSCPSGLNWQEDWESFGTEW